jgi:hypothetical protein
VNGGHLATTWDAAHMMESAGGVAEQRATTVTVILVEGMSDPHHEEAVPVTGHQIDQLRHEHATRGPILFGPEANDRLSSSVGAVQRSGAGVTEDGVLGEESGGRIAVAGSVRLEEPPDQTFVGV